VSDAPAVFVISGPMAAGKTTVARLLAARFEHGVHLDGDAFRRNIITGRVEATPNLTPEAIEQLQLRYRLAAAAADGYAEAGFTVVYEDVIAGQFLAEVETRILSRPLHVVVLLPQLEALETRAAARESYGVGWSIRELYDGFAKESPRIGTWLDTSDLTPEQTVDAILDATRA
jgi:predicted kinase